MSSPKILILMGVSGSGKTAIGEQLAAELAWPFFDGDAFHPPENLEKMQHSIALTDADRESWLKALQQLIQTQIAGNQSAVIACSALKQRYRDRLSFDPAVQFIYLKGSYALINRRLRQRTGHFMPANLLDSQFATLEEPKDAWIVDVAQSPTVIVEMICEKLRSVARS